MNHTMSAVTAACLMSLMACGPSPTASISTESQDELPGAHVAAQPPMSYIVRFRQSHALGRAQSLETDGRHDEARTLAAATLRDDASLRGLCFEHFTAGGAEVVLRVCEPSQWEERAVTQRRWLAQLGATPGVAYVDRNFAAERQVD